MKGARKWKKKRRGRRKMILFGITRDAEKKSFNFKFR